MIKIDCYLSMNCASEEPLRENIKRAIDELEVDAEVNYFRITEKEAERLGLRGSPSVLINGKDIQPIPLTGFS